MKLIGIFLVALYSSTGWVPFYLPFQDSVSSHVDVSFLNHKPAGKYGYVRADEKGDLFFEGNRKRVRFWGVQHFYKDPPSDIAEMMALRLSKYGFNMWKWGALELFWNENISSAKWKSKVDKFDYLFYQMKKNGIYCYAQIDEYGLIYPSLLYDEAKKYYDINKIDSFPLKKKFITKTLQYLLENSLFNAQKKYWYSFFNHRNPYTGLKYKNDTSIAVVELTNENFLLTRWEYWGIRYDLWPSEFRNILFTKWNSWLQNRYSSREELNSSWSQIGKIGLKPGEKYGAVEFLPTSRKNLIYSNNRKKDVARFLIHLQNAYFDSCSKYLRRIGVKSLIINGNGKTVSVPVLYSASNGDIMDTHIYFDSPDRLGREGKIDGLNPFNEEELLLSYIAANSVSGKPVSVSEVNWSYPNRHQYLFIPYLSSYASFQKWDIIIFHAYSSVNTPDCKYIEQQLVFGNNPLIMSHSMSGSLIFRKNFLKSDTVCYRLHYPEVWRNYLNTLGYRFYDMKENKNLNSFLPICVKVRKEFSGSDFGCNFNIPDDFSTCRSTTGEMIFNSGEERFTVDNDYVQIYAGKVKNEVINMKYLTLDSFVEDYCSIILIPLDTVKLKESSKLLLNVVSEVKNGKSVWNERGKSFKVWGGKPVMIRKPDMRVTLKNRKVRNLEVWAVDTLGNRKGKVEVKKRKDVLSFEISAGDSTLWYCIYESVRE